MSNTFEMNIIPSNDQDRIKALRRYRILGTPPENALDNVARLATQIFHVPISLVSLVDEESVFFKADIGMGTVKAVPRELHLSSLAIMNAGVTVFEDVHTDPYLLSNPDLVESFGFQFYAGAPLTTFDGFRIGTLCIIDRIPRNFNKKEEVILEGLAKIVMDEIELRLAVITENSKLHESNEELSAINEEMAASNEELIAAMEDLEASRERADLIYDQLSETNLRLNIALDAGQLGSTEIDIATGNMVCTAQFKKCYGRAENEEFNYPDIFSAMLPEYQEENKRLMRIAQEAHGIYEAEYRVAWPDKSIHWVSVHGRARYNEYGAATRMVNMVSDITDRKVFELRKDDFLGIVGHELKTPITSLKANLQMLKKLKDNPQHEMIPKLIDSSAKSTEKINKLVEDLLNMHRFGEGHLKLEKSTFSVAEMLDLCCNHIRIEGKYELIVEGDRTIKVHADEHRIDQVVINLVNNAVKYAPGSKNIHLIIERAGNFAKISVKDSGPGIPADQLQHLFDRYWRANHDGPKYTGLGLGLYICAEIIYRHHGEIGVDSEIGKGSTFWFTIPL